MPVMEHAPTAVAHRSVNKKTVAGLDSAISRRDSSLQNGGLERTRSSQSANQDKEGKEYARLGQNLLPISLTIRLSCYTYRLRSMRC